MTAAGIYLHVPFCSVICPYCDFAVVTGNEARRARFVGSLLAEIELWREHRGRFDGVLFDTIYFGGGTPSLLTGDQLTAIVSALHDTFDIDNRAWLSLEANPDDVDRARLDAWRAIGFRTVSLGVQSFQADPLRFLGRRHTVEQSRQSVASARAAGFDIVSVDLIYALPGDDRERWLRDLDQATAVAPDHLSCYQLTVHDSTPFGRRRDRGLLTELAEDPQAELFQLTHEYLAQHGLSPYEVSSFARSPLHRSRHNQKYWYHVPYLGLGPSAHSFDGVERWWNQARVDAYATDVASQRLPIEGRERLTASQRAMEATMLRLRTTDGVDLAVLRDDFGVDLESTRGDVIDSMVAQGLVQRFAGQLRPTPSGLAVADALARRLID